MAQEKKQYSVEFKRQVVETAKDLLKIGKSSNEIGKNWGLAGSMITKWIKAYDAGHLEFKEPVFNKTEDSGKIVESLNAICLAVNKTNIRLDSIYELIQARLPEVIPGDLIGGMLEELNEDAHD